MEIIKIISEWKKPSNIKYGCKRVEAIVNINGFITTRHLDIDKKTGEIQL